MKGVTNIYINAMDADSFKEIVKKNPGAIIDPVKNALADSDEKIIQAVIRSLKNNKYRVEFKRAMGL